MTPPRRGSISRTPNVNANHALHWAGFDSSVDAGLQYRRTSGGFGKNRDLGPILSVNLYRDKHTIQFYYNTLDQRQRSEFFSQDVTTHNVSLNYSYNTAPHQFTAIVEYSGYLSDVDKDNAGFHFGLQYLFQFDKPAKGNAGGAATADLPGAAFMGGGQQFSLADLAPLVEMVKVEDYLAGFGFSRLGGLSCCEIYGARVFPTLFDSQQLLLIRNNWNLLEKSAVLIDIHNPRSAERQLKTVVAELTRRFGNPTTVISEGDYTQLNRRVARGDFRRIFEWRTASGRLRAGIPQGLDGRGRIEMQHALFSPALSDAYWSIEQVPSRHFAANVAPWGAASP